VNKIEIIATFTAMDELYENKNYESLGKVIKKVLKVAEGEPSGKKPSKDGDEEET